MGLFAFGDQVGLYFFDLLRCEYDVIGQEQTPNLP